ncbi:MAG: MFS transporter [Coriobacteriales bacterium]|jgi:MFS family permease
MNEVQSTSGLKKLRGNPNAVISIIAVLLVAILCQSSGAENPALEYMAEEFNYLPMSTITMVTTLPSLMMIPASLAFSWLRTKFSFRPLFVVSAILLIVGGVMPAFAADFVQVLVWRAIFGLGVGVMWPLAQSLIVELYDGEKQNTMLGWNSVVTACGGIIWQNVGGVLALSGWRMSFYTYFIPIAVLVFCGIFIPNTLPASKKAREEHGIEEDADSASKAEQGYIGLTVLLLIAYFAFNFFSMLYYTNISFKIVGENIGESDLVGITTSMLTLGSLVIGIIFGKMMNLKFFGKYAMCIGWLLAGFGMLIGGVTMSIPLLFIGGFIQGFGTGTYMPAMVGLIGNVGGKAKASVILGISTCVLGASQFFGPTIMNLIVESMGLTNGSPCITMGATCQVICGIIATIVFVAIKKSREKKAAATAAE